MIKGNVLEFGYGDMIVRVNQFKECLVITNIKPPVKCGTMFSDIKELDGFEIGNSVEIYEDNLHDIYKLICTVSLENKIVKYKEWIFDFSNYNEDSVRVAKKFAYNITDIRCLAC